MLLIVFMAGSGLGFFLGQEYFYRRQPKVRFIQEGNNSRVVVETSVDTKANTKDDGSIFSYDTKTKETRQDEAA